MNGSCVHLERDGYMLAFRYANNYPPTWTYLPPKRGHLKKGTNAVGRVHTHNHLLMTSQYRYYSNK